LKIKTKDFRYDIGEIVNDDLIIIDRKYEVKSYIKKNGDLNKNNKKLYQYRCKVCGFDGGEHYSCKNNMNKYDYWICESDLNRGLKCSCCSNHITVEGINDIPTTAPFMIPYFQGGYNEAKLYTKSSGEKINPICPDCGRIKNKEVLISSIYKTHSIGCSCSDGFSYPNKFMYNILEQLGIDFVSEYSPNWIKPKRYDFYIPSKNIIIEMDGELGHGKKIHSKDNKTLKETINIDNYKDEQAKINNIKVIRINCDKSKLEFIKQNILKSRLNKLFDFSTINWLKVEEFALSNMVKEACDLWNSGVNSTKEIGIIMNLHYATITNYLKKRFNIRLVQLQPKR